MTLTHDRAQGACSHCMQCRLPVCCQLTCHPTSPKPVSPGAGLHPHGPVHLQCGSCSLENPAWGARGPRIAHAPNGVAHHHGNDTPAPGWVIFHTCPLLPRSCLGSGWLLGTALNFLSHPQPHLSGLSGLLLSRVSLCS